MPTNEKSIQSIIKSLHCIMVIYQSNERYQSFSHPFARWLKRPTALPAFAKACGLFVLYLQMECYSS